MTDLDPIAVEADKFANQRATELSWLIDILRQTPPSRVLEIGVEHGGSLWAWAQVATDDAKLMGIDAGLSGNGFEETMARWPWPTRAQQTLKLRHDRSETQESVADAHDYFRGEIDFLFIDADHAFEAVKSDWELYSPLIREGGIAGFHDVANQAKEFWNYIKPFYPTDEFIDPIDRGCGMGVIYL